MADKKKRLKDKVWNICNIKIDHYVAQYQEGAMTTNKTIGFLVTISEGRRKRTMFRADSIRKLWKEIKYHSMVSKF
jgi:hypothetical protein